MPAPANLRNALDAIEEAAEHYTLADFKWVVQRWVKALPEHADVLALHALTAREHYRHDDARA